MRNCGVKHLCLPLSGDIGGVGGVPGTFYARVSAQIYTEMSDLQNLADAVLAIIAANGGK